MTKILILSLILSFISCASSSETAPEVVSPTGEKVKILDKDELILGTSFLKGTEITRDKNGNLKQAILNSEQALLDEKYSKAIPHKFPVGTIVLYSSPKNTFGEAIPYPEFPKSITVRKPVSVFGYGFPAGSSFSISTAPGTPKNKKDAIPGIYVENTMYELTINGKKVQGGSTIFLEDKDKAKQLKNPKKGEWIDL
ncbi:MAG: hypothetical protein SFU98_07935 [Leptospiraceae bacterium]|nr:hypothetical protein [Leptospiraceae bacterium]